MTETGRITLDLDMCFQDLQRSISRVNLFSCIGQNLELNSLPQTWLIRNEGGVDMGMNDPKPEEMPHILEGFQHFLQLYLVRDVIETFALALDEMFALLLLQGKTGAPDGSYLHELFSAEDHAEIAKFKQEGLVKDKNGKVNRLAERHGLELSEGSQQILKSFRDIRNCFAHTNGVVRATDGEECDDASKREFCWKVVHIWSENEDTGEQFPVESNKIVPAGLAVKMQIKEHRKQFFIGERLSFSPIESYKIAMSLRWIADEYLQKFRERQAA